MSSGRKKRRASSSSSLLLQVQSPKVHSIERNIRLSTPPPSIQKSEGSTDPESSNWSLAPLQNNESILRRFPEHVLGTIFFSGYFNSLCICRHLIRVSKHLKEISKKFVCALDLRATVLNYRDVYVITANIACNLVYLDLGYTSITDGFGQTLVANCRNTLKGIIRLIVYNIIYTII